MKTSILLKPAYIPCGAAIMGLVAWAAPATADVTAKVEGEFQINFSPMISPVVVSTTAGTFFEELGADVTALAEAAADFTSVPPQNALAEAKIHTDVEGGKPSFFGEAGSLATTSGLFLVEAGEEFYFDFRFDLNLEIGIDDPTFEMAKAIAEAGLFLSSQASDDLDISSLNPEEIEALFNQDNYNPLDNFLVSAELSSSNKSFFSFSSTPTFSFGQTKIKEDFDGLNQQLIFDIGGTYRKTFSEATLVKFESAFLGSRVSVQAVPAPSFLWGIVLIGVVGLSSKLKAQCQKLI